MSALEVLFGELQHLGALRTAYVDGHSGGRCWIRQTWAGVVKGAEAPGMEMTNEDLVPSESGPAQGPGFSQSVSLANTASGVLMELDVPWGHGSLDQPAAEMRLPEGIRDLLKAKGALDN